jgi:hypothetical protein
MQDNAKHADDRHPAIVVLRRAACSVAALATLGVLLAGCGGSSPTGGVAHLGSHTQTTSSAATGAGGSEASPGSQAVAYAACMRSHGVANFPEPQISRHGNEVSVKMAVPAGATTSNPKFKSAQQACGKLLPSGEATHQAAISPAEQARYLKAAACIRAHGVPNLPDPTFSSGGVHLDHRGLDESSPTFKAAVRACESLIPGGASGSGQGSSSSSAHGAAR